MDQGLLQGVLAVQLGLASPQQVMTAAAAFLTDKSKSIAQRLHESGVLSAERLKMLEAMVAEALKAHGGDEHRAVQSLGGHPAVFASFGGAVAADDHGKLSLAPPAPDATDSLDSIIVTPETKGRYRYAEKAEIGRGGIGRVLIAFDQHLGREVAVKELLGDVTGSIPSAGSGKSTVQEVRFLREARLTGQLEHPGIVPVHEVGERSDGTLYYTMKLVRGRTLSAALRACTTPAERLKLLPHFADLCHAIGYAHSRGVIHRDIKTENTMVGEFGETVVLDWGLAKAKGRADLRSEALQRDLQLLHDLDAGKTVAGSTVGTPAYMSPEQADGQIDTIDERSDVWSLGAVLFELLTGKTPFEGGSPFEILGKVLKETVPDVRHVEPRAPPELAAVVAKALQRDKALRYQSAKDLADDTTAFMSGKRVAVYHYSSWELLKGFWAKNKALSGALGALVVLLAIGSVIVSLSWAREQKAHKSAEERKVAAETQRAQANLNLAQAYVSAAQGQVRERDYGAAYVYAAAGLREHQRSGEKLDEEQRVALDSALYQAKVRRRFELERTLPGPEGRPWGCDLSPDGRRFAVFSERGEIWLYALEGATPPVKRSMTSVPGGLGFSANGSQLLVVHHDGTLRSLSVNDLSDLSSERLPVRNAAASLSPDRTRVVLCGQDGLATLVRIGSSEPPIVLGSGFPEVVFSADGTRIFRATAEGLVAHDGVTGARLREFKFPEREGLRPVFCSNDGKTLLASNTAGLFALDLSTGVLAEGPERRPASAASTARLGEEVVFGLPERVSRYRVGDAALTEVLWKETGPAMVAATGDGRRLAVATPGAVRVWKVREKDRSRTVASGGEPMTVEFDSTGRRAVFTSISGLTLVDLGDEPRATSLVGGPTQLCTDTSIRPDGKRVAYAGGDQVVRIFDADSRRELVSRKITNTKWGSDGLCTTVKYTADGRHLLVTTRDGPVHVLDSDTLVLEHAMRSPAYVRTYLHLSPDGRRIFGTALGGQVAMWDAGSFRLLHNKTLGDGGWLSDALATLDGKTLLTAGQDGWLRRFDMQGELWRPLKAQKAHDAWLNRMALSPDGKILATTSDDTTAKLWDPVTGELLRVFHAGRSTVGVSFSPAGDLLALGDGTALTFFPDLRALLEARGETLFEEVTRVTGRRLSGFAVVPIGDEKVAVAPEPKTDWELPRDEWQAVATDMMDHVKHLPAGTEVELVSASGEPLSPRMVAKVGDAGKVVFRPAPQRFGVRISLGSATTYEQAKHFRTGTRGLVTSVSPETTAAWAHQAKQEIDARAGHLLGWFYWESSADYSAIIPVGCAEIRVDGKPVHLINETGEIDLARKRTGLTPGWFLALNLSPGPHEVSARVGTLERKEQVFVHAGATTRAHLAFPYDEYPEDPTPHSCVAQDPAAGSGRR